MGLRAEHKDKVKSITILDDSIMIHMDNDIKSTFVFDRNIEDTPDRAWVDNIIACADSLIKNSRDEKVRSRKYMSKLYANENHYEWTDDIENYGEVGDEYDF
jgi:hypothetical protein